MGGERQGHKVGTMGDVGFFSLERGKALSTVEGGIIVTNSEAIGEALKRQSEAIPTYSLTELLMLVGYAVTLAVFSRPWLYWVPKSLPFLGLGETLFAPDFSIKRMSNLQAGMAAGWKSRLSELRRIRVKNSCYIFKSGVKATGGSDVLLSGFIRYPVLVTNSTEKIAAIRESNRLGLGGADVYPGAVDGIAELRGCIVGGTSVKAQSIVERMVTLPVHPYVTEADMKIIVNLILKPGETQKVEERMVNVGERSQ
jgi:perosamine synthetase